MPQGYVPQAYAPHATATTEPAGGGGGGGRGGGGGGGGGDAWPGQQQMPAAVNGQDGAYSAPYEYTVPPGAAQ